MIIYGWNTKNIKQAPMEHECANCGQKEAQIAIFSHYAHIFWIPLFPYKKSAQIVCSHCNYAAEEKDFKKDSEMRNNLKQLKAAVGVPKYLFTGLIILVLGIGFLIYNGNKNTQLEEQYISNPEVGDVYLLKDLEEQSAYKYYLLKVVDLEDDSLYMSFNSYTYNGIISSLDPKDGFYNISYATHKDEIKQMHQEGVLKKVYRDYTDRSGFNRTLEFTLPDSTGTE